MKKYRFEVIIFVIEAVCMILELVASRILSPYFGNSNIVWTSVIGIILLSASIGNYIGGIIADKENVKRNLKIILIITVIFMLLIPVIEKYVIDGVISITDNIKIGAILSTLLLFFIPSVLMGLVSPIIVKLKLENMETAGKIAGKINAISTIGGIVGTFLGGFFLIPQFGSINILFILTILVLLMIPLTDLKIKSISNIFVVSIIIISVFSMYYITTQNNAYGGEVLENKDTGYISFDTQYGRVLVYNRKRGNDNIRILEIDSGYESLSYTDEDKIYELASDYTKYYDLMFKANIDINNTLLIGGGGYSYPKYYIIHFEDKKMDVVEIDEGVTQIARKYFFLDKLIEDYNLEENNRLNLINEDGRVYINNNTKKYDAILNDAFSGETPVETLTTIEAIQNIKKSLNENGMYLTNVISSLEGEKSRFLKAEVNTLKQEFRNVYVIPTSVMDDKTQTANIMVIATDDDIDFENAYELNIAPDEIILTDDYCPIDTLIPQD